jgi:hypothetical protein
LFPLTGEVRLRNTSSSAVPFVFYSIESPSGALNTSPAVWRSITDSYDVSGNGFIDPAFNWTKISSDPTELTEGAFSGPGGSLAAYRSVTFGNIWNTAVDPAGNLTITVLHADESPVNIITTPKFFVAGDYDGNGIVDGLDYNTWREDFGSTTELDADGNLNGVVDAADYVVFRDHFGQMLPGSGSGGGLSLGGTGVPEPAAIGLFVGAGISALISGGRGRRFAPRGGPGSLARR